MARNKFLCLIVLFANWGRFETNGVFRYPQVVNKKTLHLHECECVHLLKHGHGIWEQHPMFRIMGPSRHGAWAHLSGQSKETLRYNTGRHGRWCFNVGRIWPIVSGRACSPALPGSVALLHGRLGGRSSLCTGLHTSRPEGLVCRVPARNPRRGPTPFPPPSVPCI